MDLSNSKMADQENMADVQETEEGNLPPVLEIRI